jgi:hypothetical protein
MSLVMSRRRILQMAMAVPLIPGLRFRDLPPTTSRVYPGVDGRLVYVPDDDGNTILDASHAGYKGGGVGIPTVPIRETIWPVLGDNTEHVQAAIDRVSALPLDSDGFRGAVLLRAGYYRLATPLSIRASGVVLRGEGMGDTGTILIGTNGSALGGGRRTLLTIGGASGVTTQDGTAQAISDDYVPVGARRFMVRSAQSFRPGDSVIVRRIGNQEWIDVIGMGEDNDGATWQPFNVDLDRVVVDVQGNTITVDAPITSAIDERWGGGEVMRYVDPERIENVGVENLRAMSVFDPTVRTTEWGNMDRPGFEGEEYYSDENHYRNFIDFGNTKDGWVRNVTALHFVNSMVATQSGAKWITVQDCVSREPISRIWGARRFTFSLRGQLALVQRCDSDKGRHSFVTGQPSASGNVFLECNATTPFSSSEPHSQWSTGTLFDNVQAPLTARFWRNIGIGWAGANTVFWNCEGDFLVQKPPTAQNFSFGHKGVNAVVYNIPLQDPTKENGHIESQGRHVRPRSLYLTQLAERLGEGAVRQLA